MRHWTSCAKLPKPARLAICGSWARRPYSAKECQLRKLCWWVSNREIKKTLKANHLWGRRESYWMPRWRKPGSNKSLCDECSETFQMGAARKAAHSQKTERG